ncbi:unnamed protein product, partial [Strongylus vulgaris]
MDIPYRDEVVSNEETGDIPVPSTTYTSWSSGDEPGHSMSVEHIGESDESYYYDAQEELYQENPVYLSKEQILMQNQSEQTAGSHFNDMDEPSSSSSNPAGNIWQFQIGESDESYYYDAQEELYQENPVLLPREQVLMQNQSEQTVDGYFNEMDEPSSSSSNPPVFFHPIKYASCSNLPTRLTVREKKKRRQTLPEMSFLHKMVFCFEELQSEGQVENNSQSEGRAEDNVDQQIRSRMNMLHIFDPLRRELADQMSAKMNIKETSSKGGDIRKLRIDAKKECLRLWDAKVENLAELLCFLQLFHLVKGPMSIDECEFRIEKYVNPTCVPGTLSWDKYGPGMDVTRMFELKMFRLVKPSDRKLVQPVDCILDACFRMLPEGLPSELY